MKHLPITTAVQSQIKGFSSPVSGTYKVGVSDGEVKVLHFPKGIRFSGKIKDFLKQDFCVVCGRESQVGSNFCSMSCQSEQYGV
jgi:hypothetical protein